MKALLLLSLIAVTIPRHGSWFCEYLSGPFLCGMTLKRCQTNTPPKERNVDFYCVTELKVRNNVRVEE